MKILNTIRIAFFLILHTLLAYCYFSITDFRTKTAFIIIHFLFIIHVFVANIKLYEMYKHIIPTPFIRPEIIFYDTKLTAEEKELYHKFKVEDDESAGFDFIHSRAENKQDLDLDYTFNELNNLVDKAYKSSF